MLAEIIEARTDRFKEGMISLATGTLGFSEPAKLRGRLRISLTCGSAAPAELHMIVFRYPPLGAPSPQISRSLSFSLVLKLGSAEWIITLALAASSRAAAARLFASVHPATANANGSIHTPARESALGFR
jgi:hypothetical protein